MTLNLEYKNNEACFDWWDHKPHFWRNGFLNLRKRYCRGIHSKYLEDRFPDPKPYDIGMPVFRTLGEQVLIASVDHKHRFQLSAVIFTPAGIHLSPDYIYWQCESCTLIWSVHRLDWFKASLAKQVFQTWPQ